jgi:hypothetical protein
VSSSLRVRSGRAHRASTLPSGRLLCGRRHVRAHPLPARHLVWRERPAGRRLVHTLRCGQVFCHGGRVLRQRVPLVQAGPVLQPYRALRDNALSARDVLALRGPHVRRTVCTVRSRHLLAVAGRLFRRLLPGVHRGIPLPQHRAVIRPRLRGGAVRQRLCRHLVRAVSRWLLCERLAADRVPRVRPRQRRRDRGLRFLPRLQRWHFFCSVWPVLLQPVRRWLLCQCDGPLLVRAVQLRGGPRHVRRGVWRMQLLNRLRRPDLLGVRRWFYAAMYVCM